jgi:alkaline phosphatase
VESDSGKKLDIMLGGGRASFLPWSRKPQPANRTGPTPPGFDYEDENDMWENYRDDGRDLLDEWENLNGKRKYIDSLGQLLAKNLTDADKVMGIFTNSYMVWDDMAEAKGKPTIAEMATSAVSFLKAKAGPEGFFIMIEGGRIDAAHHNGHAVRALSETLAFDKAIEEVLKLVDLEETLVLVTADHAHTMSIGGYTHRELNITGSNAGEDLADNTMDDLSILSYGNGPGFRNLMTEGEGDYTQINRSNVTLAVNQSAPLKFRQPSASPLRSETHGGDDVGIWAAGPWSSLIHGVHEQSYIATVMSYAGCLGKHSTREGCPRRDTRSGASSNHLHQATLLATVICAGLLNAIRNK